MTANLGASPDQSLPSDLSLITVYADALNDLEAQRIAQGNRAGALERDKGLGGSDAHDVLLGVHDALEHIEHDLTRALERAVNAHPWVGPFVAARRRIGAKTLGRLLGAIGDPAWHHAEDRPRRLYELYAYCGYHVVDGAAPRYRRGQKANWNAEARKRTWLCVEKVAFADHHYHDVYLATREKHAEAVHMAPCVQCGSAGKPAEIGTSLRAGHVFARARRACAKALLKDLWTAARQSAADDQGVIAGGGPVFAGANP